MCSTHMGVFMYCSHFLWSERRLSSRWIYWEMERYRWTPTQGRKNGEQLWMLIFWPSCFGLVVLNLATWFWNLHVAIQHQDVNPDSTMRNWRTNEELLTSKASGCVNWESNPGLFVGSQVVASARALDRPGTFFFGAKRGGLTVKTDLGTGL